MSEATGDIEVTTGMIERGTDPRRALQAIRHAIDASAELGSVHVRANVLVPGPCGGETTCDTVFARDRVCFECGAWYDAVRPAVFHQRCPFCEGKGCDRCALTGGHPDARSVTWNGCHFDQLLALSAQEFAEMIETVRAGPAQLHDELQMRARSVCDLGLGYLSLDRPSPTLSRGEAQRLKLSVCLSSKLELLHLLDEPTIGLHPVDTGSLFSALRKLKGPVVLVEHDRGAVLRSDDCIQVGPGAGSHGGQIVFHGPPEKLVGAELEHAVNHLPNVRDVTAWITVRSARANNLKEIDIRIPAGQMTVVTGVSGSGKSSLVHSVIGSSISQGTPVNCDALESPMHSCVVVDQGPIGRNPRSNPATYTKLADLIRDGFAAATGLSKSSFSFNREEGACPRCKGLGAEELAMRYLPSMWLVCPRCSGRRFSDELIEQKVEIGGEQLSIADVYDHRIDDIGPALMAAGEPTDPGPGSTGVPALRFGDSAHRRLCTILGALHDIGLGYLTLGQPSPTLSGGEAQRVKLSKYLGKKNLAGDVIVLDEPSTGLHPDDVANLLGILTRLRESGSTIIIVEHSFDVIRACDWVIDLGPGPGPLGGSVVYQGRVGGLSGVSESATGRALAGDGEWSGGRRERETPADSPRSSGSITIRGATLHNLKQASVDIPACKLTVVTGVSGSGKSSLVGGVLENEARRRFLETMSMYERQGVSGSAHPGGAEIEGLGVTIAVGTQKERYDPRATVGSSSEVVHKLAVLFAFSTTRSCEQCAHDMDRTTRWTCPACGESTPILSSRSFYRTNYRSACTVCNGVGTQTLPSPEKLIIHPERPLCDGAMYSPGFFPKGYLCKPFNGGYYVLQALAVKHGFDPTTTPWSSMSTEAQQAFLYGDPEELTIHYENKKGRSSTHRQRYPGFYGWIGDWDLGGTYTDTAKCHDCGGSGLRPASLAVRYADRSIHDLCETSLSELLDLLSDHPPATEIDPTVRDSVQLAYTTAVRRLRFLVRTGLGYINLNRLDATLSAGESQRVSLARLLGSGLSSLTVLLDEPTRGMHPSEVETLLSVLQELRDEGNTVVVVEHDAGIVEGADWVVAMGPASGASGGHVVYQGAPAGRPAAVIQVEQGSLQARAGRARRRPGGWMEIQGASENNLKSLSVAFPLGVLTGVCGVSGSGKSTLVIDTLARVVAPTSHTTSVAYEPIAPGRYDKLTNQPRKTLVIDQSRVGVVSPATFLGLDAPLANLYAHSEEAAAVAMPPEMFRRNCESCRGTGRISADMGFLPNIYEECDACGGSGYRAEVAEIRVGGVTIAEASRMTFDELRKQFGVESTIANKLDVVNSLGLGYLVFHQPGVALSGGEAQRLKIVRQLLKKKAELYILDEPTVGQALSDVGRLIRVLHLLVAAGSSIIVVEHHPHLLAACDWLIELGPGAGPQGGRVVAAGTPEAVAAGTSATARYIRAALEDR